VTVDLKPRMEFALDVAKKAGELILGYYQSKSLQVESKRDSSPVTAADREAEALIRTSIVREFPGDGVMGEELGAFPSANGFKWILDPVDGTKSFIHGVPLFGTLIGLEFDKRLVLGACRFPALNEVVYAQQGEGAWWQDGNGRERPAHVSRVVRLSDALLCITTISGFQRIGRYETFEKVRSAVKLTRGWGDCYGHALVATGRADVMIDPLMNPWDAAPFIPILQEAGGHFLDWEGQPSIYSGNGISVNDALKDNVLDLLHPGES
jgi:myo-inositol-1(or 4)-monophosphatase